jgi:NAD(P)-dependent dehydrogenase (short-subunit alcohol dehydrogenase family)
LVEFAVGALGGLDMLFLNHAVQHHAGLVNGRWKQKFDDDPSGIGLLAMQENVQTNAWSYVALASYALPHLAASSGSIGVVSSLAGKFGIPQMVVYNMGKHAVNGFFAGLRAELRMLRQEVSVTVHTLGSVDTEGARECTKDVFDVEAVVGLWAASSDAARSIVIATALRRPEHHFPFVDVTVLLAVHRWMPSVLDRLFCAAQLCSASARSSNATMMEPTCRGCFS